MISNTKGNLAYQEKKFTETQIIKKIKKKTLPAGEKIFYLFFVLFIVILAGTVISGYAQITEYNYSIQKLRNSIVDINDENDQLQRKIAELSSPERVIQIAQNELGMKLDEQRVIVLSRSFN